jgi:hypothetical protein
MHVTVPTRRNTCRKAVPGASKRPDRSAAKMLITTQYKTILAGPSAQGSMQTCKNCYPWLRADIRESRISTQALAQLAQQPSELKEWS